MTDPIRVVHLDPGDFGDVETEAETFRDALGDVTVEAIDCDADEIADRVDRTDILASLNTPIPAEAIDATGCEVVAMYATGVDGVDVEAATNRGVRVTRVPTYCDDEVAEHAIALALALLRGLPHYDAETASGGWEWTGPNPLYGFSELTFGLLAFGRKARATAERARALGFTVIAHDPYCDESELEAAGVEPVSFDDLLARSDVLSIHAPLTAGTRNLLDADAFAAMKEGAVLVNTARGAVVDEDDLLAALEDGTLSGAGLDVFATEPPAPDHPLRGRADTIVTPHVAWNSEGAARRLRVRGSRFAIAALEGRETEGLVNPESLAVGE